MKRNIFVLVALTAVAMLTACTKDEEDYWVARYSVDGTTKTKYIDASIKYNAIDSASAVVLITAKGEQSVITFDEPIRLDRETMVYIQFNSFDGHEFCCEASLCLPKSSCELTYGTKYYLYAVHTTPTREEAIEVGYKFREYQQYLEY